MFLRFWLFMYSLLPFLRENLLQEAATKNQEFQSANKSLSSFLNSLPDNNISPSDDLSQINSKQSSEEVCSVRLHF